MALHTVLRWLKISSNEHKLYKPKNYKIKMRLKIKYPYVENDLRIPVQIESLFNGLGKYIGQSRNTEEKTEEIIYDFKHPLDEDGKLYVFRELNKLGVSVEVEGVKIKLEELLNKDGIKRNLPIARWIELQWQKEN